MLNVATREEIGYIYLCKLLYCDNNIICNIHNPNNCGAEATGALSYAITYATIRTQWPEIYRPTPLVTRVKINNDPNIVDAQGGIPEVTSPSKCRLGCIILSQRWRSTCVYPGQNAEHFMTMISDRFSVH